MASQMYTRRWYITCSYSCGTKGHKRASELSNRLVIGKQRQRERLQKRRLAEEETGLRWPGER